jgi:methylase of polypeptide subunit release factors
VPGDWRRWADVAQGLGTAPGVHVPSAFSALLASAMGDCAGRSVVDAGCGAGLIAIAALEAGARVVTAQDRDPAALEVTERNVASVLGPTGRERLRLALLDFAELGELEADVLAVNPPQRPARLLAAVEADQRHLHEGGGEDGLDALREVLRHARVPEVRSTAASVLPVERLDRPGRILRSAELPAHPAWGARTLRVDVWSFVSRAARAAGRRA